MTRSPSSRGGWACGLLPAPVCGTFLLRTRAACDAASPSETVHLGEQEGTRGHPGASLHSPSPFPTCPPPGLCASTSRGARAPGPGLPESPGRRAVFPALQRREDAGGRAGGPGHRCPPARCRATKHAGTSLLLPAEGVPSAVLCSLQGQQPRWPTRKLRRRTAGHLGPPQPNCHLEGQLSMSYVHTFANKANANEVLGSPTGDRPRGAQGPS